MIIEQVCTALLSYHQKQHDPESNETICLNILQEPPPFVFFLLCTSTFRRSYLRILWIKQHQLFAFVPKIFRYSILWIHLGHCSYQIEQHKIPLYLVCVDVLNLHQVDIIHWERLQSIISSIYKLNLYTNYRTSFELFLDGCDDRIMTYRNMLKFLRCILPLLCYGYFMIIPRSFIMNAYAYFLLCRPTFN